MYVRTYVRTVVWDDQSSLSFFTNWTKFTYRNVENAIFLVVIYGKNLFEKFDNIITVPGNNVRLN